MVSRAALLAQRRSGMRNAASLFTLVGCMHTVPLLLQIVYQTYTTGSGITQITHKDPELKPIPEL